MRKNIFITLLAGMALLLSACGAAATPAPTAMPVATDTAVASDTAMPAAPTDTAAPPPTPSGPAALALGQNSTLGSFLTDAAGMTLYIYTKDSQNGGSSCYGGCAANWPPLLTNGTPTGATGVDASILGTSPRTDGTTQVTYNGWPLYYFAGDKAAGDTNGEGKASVWYVITPAGTQK